MTPIYFRVAHCARVFPKIPPITTRHTYEIAYKFEYICQDCECWSVVFIFVVLKFRYKRFVSTSTSTPCVCSVKRHSPSLDMLKKCCGKCRGHFNLYKDGHLWKRTQLDPETGLLSVRLC